MTISTHLAPLLTSRPIVLWVEDRLTKEYLSEVWQADDALIQILVAGGNDAVTGVVHDLRGQGYHHVFGFADRDFKSSNKDKWLQVTSGIVVFRPTVLEIENFLLDWDALAGCDENCRKNRTSDEIRERAENYVRTSIWWMSCRNVLSEIRSRLVDDYPHHPTMEKVQSCEEAMAYIKTNRGWLDTFPGHAEHIMNFDEIEKSLHSAYDKLSQSFENGQWFHEFSGKEIYRHVRGYLFNEKYAGVEAMDIDLAKSVAKWQSTNESLPEELLELSAALKMRVGI
ncbi:MAG: hypothetical protein ACOYL3_10435 [Desulfuromonadaceae bacterium]